MSCNQQQPLDPFSILGLPRFAPLCDIKATYRKLAPLYLHDVHAKHQFTIISAAFEVLTTSQEKLLRQRRFTDPYLLFAANVEPELPTGDHQRPTALRRSVKRESPALLLQQQLHHPANKRPRTAFCWLEPGCLFSFANLSCYSPWWHLESQVTLRMKPDMRIFSKNSTDLAFVIVERKNYSARWRLHIKRARSNM